MLVMCFRFVVVRVAPWKCVLICLYFFVTYYICLYGCNWILFFLKFMSKLFGK